MERKKQVKLLFLLSLAVTLTLYGSGYIAQFIYNYDSWKRDGGIVGGGTSPALPSGSFFKCMGAVFRFPSGLYGIAVCVGSFAVLMLFIMKMGNDDGGTKDTERNFIYSDKGTYGTAGYMTDQERKAVLQLESAGKTDGIILGRMADKAVCLPAQTRMNRNIAVFGASGSMKSRAFVRNMVFQCVKRGESMVLTDPKSELYNDMAEYLKNENYHVKVFNLVNPEYSDAWNCLKEIEGQEIMAQVLSDVIIKNTGSEKGDHFWDNSEQNLLKALALYVAECYPEEQKNMGEAYKLLALNSEEVLNKLFDMLPISHPAKAPYHIFKQASDSVRSGIIIGLGTRMQVFQNKLIRDMTSHDDMNLTLPGKEKCAYFCITSDQDSTFDFLSSLFFSFLFIKLVRYADKNGKNGKLEIPVAFILDEFPNIGKIPDFTKKISTIRSRNISVSVVFQNIAQLENRYPDNQFLEILGNCDTQLFLGCTDPITAEFISNRTGEVTVGVNSHSKALNTWRVSDYTPEYKETSSTGKRKLLTPDEVLRLPLEEALIILRGQKVLRTQKFDYSLHPEAKKLIPCSITDYIPAWKNQAEPLDSESLQPIQAPKPEKKKSTKPVGRPKKKPVPNVSLEEEKETFNPVENGDKPIQDTSHPVKVTKADKDSIMS